MTLANETKKGSVVLLLSQQPRFPYHTVGFRFYGNYIIVMASHFASLESQISIHNRNVTNLTPPPTCKACQACHTMRRKDFRRRGLSYLMPLGLTNMVLVVTGDLILVRWRCKVCKFTFTDYPDFRPSL